MNSNEELINHFYLNFQQKDVQAMQNCYADNATFSDPVFTNLDAQQVRAMWAMLIKNGKDMRMQFRNVKGTDTGATAEWDAWYTFSLTGNKVLNRIKASFEIRDGKIVAHRDHFSFYNWSRQALGFTGLLLGWTSFLRDKISKTAKKNLENFMASVKS
ncbi:nuclear transport factor 2 family protein [Pedobacter frigoris]|uniref:Nuclear transport factor 2 family protein n=1 Tax=Pedobacter frigoris TaxID=2571272 RepID=A0A4U1CQF6_9SPHI|nr:nuclear transport factor 2 family protein [Pedobacter frigoris]TKC07664.1 nuclear transport factor 2 family protein [Pedobacter frigoris]